MFLGVGDLLLGLIEVLFGPGKVLLVDDEVLLGIVLVWC